jgi:hypothetical protein
MTKEQQAKILEGLRRTTINSLKAQFQCKYDREESWNSFTKGIVLTLQNLGYGEFVEKFHELEVGHYFSLNGSESEEKLKDFFKEMDELYWN